MVFMCSDQRKKGSHGFSVRSLEKAFNRESKKSATYFVGSSSAFVGAAALAEAGAAGAEPAGIPTADDISLDIATKYGIR